MELLTEQELAAVEAKGKGANWLLTQRLIATCRAGGVKAKPPAKPVAKKEPAPVVDIDDEKPKRKSKDK